LKNIVTADEAWVYGCDADTKHHSSQWKISASPSPQKEQVRPNVKAVLIVFSTIEALFIMSSLLQARRLIVLTMWRFWEVCGLLYEENLECRLRECDTSITTKLGLHSSVREFLAKLSVPVLPPPPPPPPTHSPDLSAADFFFCSLS
jgi:hypothetical protein